MFTERINGPTDIRKQEPKAEEKHSSELKNTQDSLKVAVGHEEMSELNLPKDGKHVVGQEALKPAAEQAASEEIEREELLNYDAKEDDLHHGKAGW